MEIEKRFYSNGIPLASTIYVPGGKENLEGKYPAVILCHGHSRYRNDGLDALAAVLGDKGIASIRFDFRGCGEYAVNRYSLQVASEMPEDVFSALSFAESLPFIDGGRLGLAGISMGAVVVVYVGGSGDKRIKSIVSMAGMADSEKGLKDIYENNGGDWNAFLKRISEDGKIAAATGNSQMINALDMFHYSDQKKREGVINSLLEPGGNAYVTLQSVANFMRIKPIERCASIDCPIFFVHGAEDELISPANSVIMHKSVRSPGKKLKIYEGLDHNIPASNNRTAAFADIVEWFANTL